MNAKKSDIPEALALLAISNTLVAAEEISREAPGMVDPAEAEEVARSLIQQDGLPLSLRVWSGVAAIAAAILTFPGVDQVLENLIQARVPAEWIQVAMMLLSGALAWASKFKDKRPKRV